MIAIRCPFISPSMAKLRPAIKIVLALFAGDELLGERLVTTPCRQHQFLLPMFNTVRSSEFKIKVSVLQLEGCAPEHVTFEIEFDTCLRQELVSSIEEKMVWVFGSPRSGSTWLARDIICQLPSQSHPSDSSRNRPIDEMGLGAVLGAFLFEPEHFYNIDQIVTHCDPGPDSDTVRGKRTIPGRPLFQRIFYKDYNRPESMLADRTSHAIREMIRDVTFNHVLMYWGVLGYDRIIFKAPNEGHASDLIMSALPRARMIFLMRDGRDIVKSRFSPFASRRLAETQGPRTSTCRHCLLCPSMELAHGYRAACVRRA